jgi:hypothetical protein
MSAIVLTQKKKLPIWRSPSLLQEINTLEVKEVWFWQNERLIIYVFNNSKEYEKQATISLLPSLNVALLTKYINEPNPHLAMGRFRQELHSHLGN